MKKEQSDRFVKYLKSQIIIRINELSSLLNISFSTVQRKLKQLNVLKSYDYNGSYFVLEELSDFNEFGIWEHNNIHFSKYGSLKNTLIGIIINSEYGLKAVDIRKVMGIDTSSFLHHYRHCVEIRREKHGGNYIYFSSNVVQYSFQLANRKKINWFSHNPRLKDSYAIIILVEVIKHQRFSEN